MNPSKNQGLRLTSKCTEGLADIVITQLSLPRIPLKREGPLGIDLGSSFRRGQTSSAICPISHTSARNGEGSRVRAPCSLSCWSVCSHDSAKSIYLCRYPKMTWWLSKSPRCAHTESLCILNVASCTNGWDVTPCVFQGCSVLLQSSACFNMKVMT